MSRSSKLSTMETLNLQKGEMEPDLTKKVRGRNKPLRSSATICCWCPPRSQQERNQPPFIKQTTGTLTGDATALLGGRERAEAL